MSRTQLAEMLVHCLTSKEAVRKAFELVTEKGARADLDALLAATKADPINSVGGVDDMPDMPLEKA